MAKKKTAKATKKAPASKASAKKAAKKPAAKKAAAKKAEAEKPTTKKAAKKPAAKKAPEEKSADEKAPEKPSPKESAKKAPIPKKSTRHVNAWMRMTGDERDEYFASADAADLFQAMDASYLADVVGVLLELKKSTAKAVLEGLVAVRKRAVSEIVTLYYYREGLMNPLPMTLGNDDTPNYYAILGIPRDSDDDTIKTAYKLLSKAHDEAGFSPSMRASARERLSDIEDSFKQLKTAELRVAVNRKLPTMQYLYPRRDTCWLDAALRLLQ